MNVFRLQLVGQYSEYVRSFIQIRDEKIRTHVEQRLEEGMLWPEPLTQLNPSFEPGAWIDELVDAGVLHSECARIFRIKQDAQDTGRKMRMHKHQEEAARTGRLGESYVLTTGTGSGKSLSYIVPIVDHVLQRGSGKGIQAIVIYPMTPWPTASTTNSPSSSATVTGLGMLDTCFTPTHTRHHRLDRAAGTA